MRIYTEICDFFPVDYLLYKIINTFDYSDGSETLNIFSLTFFLLNEKIQFHLKRQRRSPWSKQYRCRWFTTTTSTQCLSRASTSCSSFRQLTVRWQLKFKFLSVTSNEWHPSNWVGTCNKH